MAAMRKMLSSPSKGGEYTLFIVLGALLLGVFVGMTALSMKTETGTEQSQSRVRSHISKSTHGSSSVTTTELLPPPESTRMTPQSVIIQQIQENEPMTPFIYENERNLQLPPVKPLYLPTRGTPVPYSQLGLLIGEEKGKKGEQIMLPLIGRQTHPGSSRYHYYTTTNGYHPMKLPVEHKRRTCNDGTGCDEIFSGNMVKVKGYDIDFTADIYPSADPLYIL